jgi:phosphate:Na+ symporter
MNYSEETDKMAREKETVIHELARDTTRFLAMLSRTNLPSHEHDSITDLISAINDFERIGDHAMNILELAEYKEENNLPFSNTAIDELAEMSYKVKETVDLAIFAFLHWDKEASDKIAVNEEEIDNLEKKLRINHIKRLNQGECNPSSGVIYLDLLSNLERVGDHSFNIASYILNIDKNYKEL